MAWSDPASPRQIDFVKTLFDQAKTGTENLSDPTSVESLQAHVAQVQDVLVRIFAGQEVTKGEAHNVIETLKAVTNRVKAVTPPPPVPTFPGLAGRTPERVIPNKFDKACSSCGVKVPAGTGFAVLLGGWATWCVACLNTDPAQRKAAEVQVKACAGVKQAESRAFALDLFARTGTDEKAIPEVRVAVPSATGNNDLDFYRVRWDRRKYANPTVLRVLGGHADVRLDLNQAHKALEQVVFVDDAVCAMVTFGRELGACGHCGKSLTDEASRAAGIGPVCAANLF